ncbi:MAG: DNA polymerase III subunit epsilon [Limnohabitans sp.]|nr:DNA polymerase III subunit epsilon [Limnohabitans sp.]
MSENYPLPQSAELLAQELDQHPDYKVLRRLTPKEFYSPAVTGQKLMKAVVLDTETTGLQVGNDRVMELGMVVFEFDPLHGTIHRVLDVFDELEDPDFPIPPEITAINRITNEMVDGKKINDQKVEQLLADVQVVIAHNASFDRPFIEERWPIFKEFNWACSIRDIDWKAEGFGSAKLEYLLTTQGIFYEAHRAETDCWALLELLHRVLPQSQQPALLALLQTLNQAQTKLYATGAPFDSKNLLKARNYRWAPEIKCWHKTMASETDLKAEFVWLRNKVYGSKRAVVELEKLGGQVRYSLRAGERTTVSLD